MRLATIALGLALATAPTLARAEWVKVSTSARESDFYMDGARITSENGRVHAWIKVDHSRNKSIKYRSEMELISFICSSQKSRVLQYTEYDSYGNVVGSSTIPDTTYSDVGYETVTPETVNETLMRAACAVTQ